MHHIHHTHGFILGSRNVGEANKMVTIYTKELGLIRAMVQGIRLSKSRLKFSLQDFTYATIDLVRGRDIWRITSASSITSFPYARRQAQSLILIARVSSLLERLCGMEESHPIIFDDLIKSLYYLDSETILDSSREALELHLVLRIVHALGYIGESSLIASYIESSFDEHTALDLIRERKNIVAHINRALNESML